MLPPSPQHKHSPTCFIFFLFPMLLAVTREGGEYEQAVLEPGVARSKAGRAPDTHSVKSKLAFPPAFASFKDRKRKENPPLIFPHQFNQTSFQVPDTVTYPLILPRSIFFLPSQERMGSRGKAESLGGSFSSLPQGKSCQVTLTHAHSTSKYSGGRHLVIELQPSQNKLEPENSLPTLLLL